MASAEPDDLPAEQLEDLGRPGFFGPSEVPCKPKALKPQALQQFAGFESDSRKRSLSNLWENTRMTRKLKGNCSMNKCYYRAPNPNP